MGFPGVLKDALRAEMAPAAPHRGEHPRVMGCKAPQQLLDGVARLHPEVPPVPAVPHRTHGPRCGQTDRQAGHCWCPSPASQASILLAPLLRTVLEQLGHLLPRTSPPGPSPTAQAQPLPLPQLQTSPGKPRGSRHPLGMRMKRSRARHTGHGGTSCRCLPPQTPEGCHSRGGDKMGGELLGSCCPHRMKPPSLRAPRHPHFPRHRETPTQAHVPTCPPPPSRP